MVKMESKIMVLLLVSLLVLPLVVAEQPTNVVWWEHEQTYGNDTYTFTNINSTFNEKTKTFTFQPKVMYERSFMKSELQNVTDPVTNTTYEDLVEIIPSISEANYTNYINITFYEEYAHEQSILERKKNQNISDNLIVTGNLQVVGNITGGSPVKLKGGVEMVGYEFEGFNKLKDIFNRIKARLLAVETDIQTIKDNGYTGVCANGVNVNQGIVTGCA